MRLARLAVVPLLAFPSIGYAADTIAQVAILTSGLADGAQTMIGGFGTGAVTVPQPGYYEIAFDKGVVKFLFDETDTCRVNVHAEIPTQGSADLRYDLTRVTGITVDDRGTFEGLNAAVITLEGDEVVQVLMNDNWVTQPGFAFLVGSITLEEYQAAADELQRIC